MSSSIPYSKPSTASPTPPVISHDNAKINRRRPIEVQTLVAAPAPTSSFPTSAVSISSMASSSQQVSPALSPSVAGRANGSAQASPELFDFPRGRACEELLVPHLHLGESMASSTPNTTLSRKTSANSLAQSGLTSPAPSSAGLVRRTSQSINRKAKDLLGVRRRTSSAHPPTRQSINRDGSVGPVLRPPIRRPSNPVPVASETLTGQLQADSDGDVDDREDNGYAGVADFGARDLSSLHTTGPCGSSTAAPTFTTGPVVPLQLRKGTAMTKVSKKRSAKRIMLYLDPDAAKICLDKNRSSKTVYLDDIKEIRTGDEIRQYRLDAGLEESMETRFFTIIYGEPDRSGNKLLHLVADTAELFQIWNETLGAIYKHRHDFASSLLSFNDRAIRTYWHREMRKQHGDKMGSPEDGDIDFLGVERVCRHLHIHVPLQDLREKFEAAHKSGDRLNYGEFSDFVRLMKTRRDIRQIYREHTADAAAGMTFAEFLGFVCNVQREDRREEKSWDIFRNFARRPKLPGLEKAISGNDEAYRMSEGAFASYLTSVWNLPIPDEPHEFELKRPMNEYYISSSHNTYLLGRQVAGVSSVEGYISALMRGCRCVEIDVWAGPDNRPVVVHGRTLTTQISFHEVIKTINKFAFVKSLFPLWVSLEVRCNATVQVNMVRIMLDTFGDKLVRHPLDPASDRLPTPSQLRGRILIKVKKSQPENDGFFKRMRSNSHPSPYQRPLPMDNTPIPSSPILSPSPAARPSRQINTINEGQVHEGPSSSTSECESDSEKDSISLKGKYKIIPVLGELGVYSSGIHVDGFENPEAKTFNHIFSFKEKTFAERNQPGDAKRALYRHNMRYMMRVYPNATRINSSNFDPLIYWKRGVQMAALNWQTFDLGMQINQAMFDSGTDQSGYVLKPIEAREFQVMPTLLADAAGKRPRKNIHFKIDVISAQQLMRPINLGERRSLDPYVEVEVFLADDKRNKLENASNAATAGSTSPLKYRTKVVKENGFNPIFNEKITFNVTTKYPDLIFVRWTVRLATEKGLHSDRTPPIATFTAKLNSLKQGYRTLPLLDHNGDRYLFSTLFCRIETEYTDIMVSYPGDVAESSEKLKFGRNVFRSSSSPKMSSDGGPA